MRNRAWAVFVSAVFAIKAAVFALDNGPRFFLGDSALYLMTANDGYVPLDRSFTYGYVIRLVSLLREDSFLPLLSLQVLASAISAILLAYVLLRYLSAPPGVAYLFGLLCAVEPLQLLYERYIMTETFSLLLLVLCLTALFHYVKHATLKALCAVQLIGILLLSFRISYLSIVLINIFLPPFLMAFSPGRRENPPLLPFQALGSLLSSRWRPALTTGIHLLVSVSVAFILHTGYKHLFATLSGEPVGYNAANGFFLVAAWAPTVVPEDFPHTELRESVFKGLEYNLQERAERTHHLFAPNGLIDRIRRAVPGPEANRAAQTTALNSMRRNPAGIVHLCVQTFLDYFDPVILQNALSDDLSINDNQFMLYSEMYSWFDKENTSSIATPEEHRILTPTMRAYQAARIWYWLLLISPLLFAGALLFSDRFFWSYVAIPFLALCAGVTAAFALSVCPIVRYLHPVAWLALCLLGFLCGRTFHHSQSRSQRRMKVNVTRPTRF